SSDSPGCGWSISPCCWAPNSTPRSNATGSGGPGPLRTECERPLPCCVKRCQHSGVVEKGRFPCQTQARRTRRPRPGCRRRPGTIWRRSPAPILSTKNTRTSWSMSGRTSRFRQVTHQLTTEVHERMARPLDSGRPGHCCLRTSARVGGDGRGGLSVSFVDDDSGDDVGAVEDPHLSRVVDEDFEE